jgi:pimeloyl-ACP methyl ester carboxylesterase
MSHDRARQDRGMSPEPFTIAIPQAAIDDLHARLDRARLAPDFGNDDWSYGVPGTYLAELVAHWRDVYDWRAAEADMNRFHHFRVTIDGIPIHFVHEPSPNPDAMPLVLTHGWPWTFWDFRYVIEPLREHFHVVVPSLPGYGFSAPLQTTGVNPPRIAELWVRLMTEVLGYERFGAQGGDWGAIVTSYLGHAHAEHLHGVHLSMPMLLGVNRSALTAADYGPGEEGWFEKMQTRMRAASSHVAVHTADPQTLAHALNDSPVGLLAWLVERRRNWSDNDGDVEQAFTREHVLSTVSIYWLTQTIGSSMRLYAETFRCGMQLLHDRVPNVEAPTAIAVFPKELIFMPRRLAERHTNLRRWTVMPRGGHFAPSEAPDALVDDVVAFFSSLR